MSTQTAALPVATSRPGFLQLLVTGLLGAVVVGFVGFSHLDVVHNAGHDYRHSMAFPCH